MNALTSMIPETTGFHGWANHATWNVALWLQNDEAIYRTTLDYVRHCERYGNAPSYDALIPTLEACFGQITPDGVRWMDPQLDTDELDEMMAEL